MGQGANMGMGGAQMAGGYGRGQYGYPQQAGQNKKPVGNHYSIMPLIVMDLSFLTHFHCFNFYSSVRVFFISAKASAYSTFVKTQLTECCDLNFAKPWFYLSFFFFFFFFFGGGGRWGMLLCCFLGQETLCHTFSLYPGVYM